MARIDVQIRIGKGLLDEIDARAKLEEQSRSRWVENAVSDLIYEPGSLRKHKVHAKDLFTNKITILLRFLPQLRRKLDQMCEEVEDTRTVLIIDACLSKLSKRPHNPRV